MIDAEYEELDAGDGELDLARTDNLPWLEADTDDAEAGGFDIGQILAFAGVLLLVLAAIVGAVWYVSNRASSADVVADGSVIEAPAGPIKERPQDPGGKQFAGTGNLAPLVGEGETREAVVAAPAAATSSASTPAPAAGARAAPPLAPALSGVGVQLAAYSTRARAEQGWSELLRRTEALAGVKHRVVEGKVDIGTVYRLQAVAGSRAEAERLCAALKADGLDCQIK
ncbi:SPOR domain-containing protein [Erythrobacter tepidarius]|uniref:SPOR domain-containing protein n=1 Tax=Erythrobacter tepidarius TaxID=60454 RepID=UPI000A3A3468|nr:SPOR domain-containing protein [Erythrobacter tepidarius]